ncbi:small G protein signaling modulator 1 isoform X2 [Benincasa hispida]|uniref:small G protein signaling modulator 1 isoform X2 n=1 Tax=Benincasa hispida TaxID=102211 RepID=UPI0019027F58|nr:small G protein signaling modulator 1 isoform X2 [Benincasa hispida]
MSSGGEADKQWTCAKAGVASLQKVGLIVRDIGEPCLSQSPIKCSCKIWSAVPMVQVNRMLKPEKWLAAFDSDGKALGFQKTLKSIVLGGVDPSIRAEVWEFLLGCYAVGSTAEHRGQLRTARRERYKDLIEECRMIHSSIGTGSLAYPVGSKVMDMRTSSKDGPREAESESREVSVHNTNTVEDSFCRNNNCIDKSYTCRRESSSDSAELASIRESTDSVADGSTCCVPISGPCNCYSLKPGSEADGSAIVTENDYDFPPLPVIDLFKDNKDKNKYFLHNAKLSTQRELRFEDGSMHSFQINNNEDLVIESTASSSNNVSHPISSETEIIHLDSSDPEFQQNSLCNNKKPTVPETKYLNATVYRNNAVSEDRVSEWLWTLHRIVVDVVRTDSHLEFYEDTRNLARMSDILAVYAWVDPATGYCQGMSDLLSPFVVLFEDNADAFWCFEMLLRRMRENFQMEGPTRVMKQLEALWKILELTDKEIFTHLSHVGAESLHFAFPMLLVLFRRELSFNEALCMWEMMWAADFDESRVYSLEGSCLEALTLQLPRGSEVETNEGDMENSHINMKDTLQSTNGNLERSSCDNAGMKSTSAHAFCGLTRNLCSRNDPMKKCTVISSTKQGDDELPVYCVAAILIMNRQKIIRETRSIDDLIKIFNDKMLKISVKRCIRTAIKLRKKYFSKVIKKRSLRSRYED